MKIPPIEIQGSKYGGQTPKKGLLKHCLKILRKHKDMEVDSFNFFFGKVFSLIKYTIKFLGL